MGDPLQKWRCWSCLREGALEGDTGEAVGGRGRLNVERSPEEGTVVGLSHLTGCQQGGGAACSVGPRNHGSTWRFEGMTRSAHNEHGPCPHSQMSQREDL